MSSLFAALARHAREHPDRVALKGDGSRVTYGALQNAISEREKQLDKAGVEVLGLPLANSVEWLLWDLAALKAGIVCVPLPPFFTAQQVAHVMSSAGIDTCVNGSRLVAMPPQRRCNSSTMALLPLISSWPKYRRSSARRGSPMP